MSIFTSISLEYINTQLYWHNIVIKHYYEVRDGLDNTVFRLVDTDNCLYILKLYEWKDYSFNKKILTFHEQLGNFLTHKIIFYSENFIENKLWILFSYIETNWIYKIHKIIKKIDIFHDKLNPNENINSINSILSRIYHETDFFKKNILKSWYIEEYRWFIDLNYLFLLFVRSVQTIRKQNISLHYWNIHNDLCKWNIIPNNINGIEFVDFDWVNFNILLKDYIIFLIRFDKISDIDAFFKINKDFTYNIGKDSITIEIVHNLYIIYSINLIFNIIYYIWYNHKNINESNFTDTNNQTWQDIFKILQKNNFY